MQTARLFINGRSQAVRLPKEYKFKGENVYIKKIGEAVILVPYDKEWEVFSLPRFLSSLSRRRSKSFL